jgi:hypothetical protein
MRKNQLLRITKMIALLFALQPVVMAQTELPGVKWNYVTDPGLKLQLQRSNPSEYHMIYFKDFVSGREEFYNFCKFTFTGDTVNYSDAVYKFILTGDKNASRSEMKIEYKNYKENGIYQMEGEMRFTMGKPGPNHVCQVWQNMKRSGNKILIYNTITSDKGTLYVPSSQDRVGTFKSLKNVYASYNDENDKWLKVNVIHNRNTREVFIYLNGELYNKYVHYEADGDYYFKFGAYGKPSGIGDSDCVVEWRNIKFFEATAIPTLLKDNNFQGSQLRIYPNPVRETANVYYTLKSAGNIELSVLNLLGQKVKTLSEAHETAGAKNIHFSTVDLKSGTYLLQLAAVSAQSVVKFVVP